MPNEKINKDLLNEAIMLLGKTYNDPKAKYVEQAITQLKKSLSESKELQAVRADTIQEVEGNFIKFGVRWLDSWLRGGVRPQELVLIGATPHAGKTHLLSWFGIQLLLEGFKVLAVIGEDLLSDVKDCYVKGVDNVEVLKNLWLADMQDVRFGVREIEEVFEKLKAEGNAPEVIIIDHVDLMKGPSGKADWEVVSDVMVELKMFAKRTGTVVITASQANFSKELKGMERFYRAKVGKAANADIIIMVDDVINDEYSVSLNKARGRKRIPTEERQKTLLVDWDSMKIEDFT